MIFLRFTLILLILLISACGGGGSDTSTSNSGSNSNTSPASTSNSNSNSSNSSSSGSQTISGPTPTPIFTVSWIAPSQREDNSPISLAEIAAYRIYSGLSPQNLTESLTTKDGSITSQTYKDFKSGTYFFSIATLDSKGRESQLSAATKIVVTN